jgi:hypothetical protein
MATRMAETTPKNVDSHAKRYAKAFIEREFPELASHKALIEGIGLRMAGWWHDGTSYGEENAECEMCNRGW